jgi:hypothetical protein
MSEKMTGASINGKRIDDSTYQVQITTGIEWAEITVSSTGEYIGWVPYGAVLAHAAGHLSVDDLRRVARPDRPV